MNATGKLTRQDWGAMLGLFLVSFALRVPFRSQYAYHWDSAEFTLAVTQYNVAMSQPHAPGYFVYVMLGRLLNGVIGDPHASLVWLSVIFGSGLVAILYLLGRTLVDRRTGWAAALIAMTSAQCWFHSCVALTYVVDAFLVCLIVWLCWRAIQDGGSWPEAILIGGALAVAGGVREQSVPGLLPLVFYTFWKFKSQRAAKLAMAGLVAFAGALLWLIPMMRLSGGATRYLEVVRRYSWFISPHTVARNGWEAFLRNLTYVSIYLWIGLLLAGVLIGGGLFYRTCRMSRERRPPWDRENGPALKVLGLWIVPMFLVTTVIGITDQPGHVFSYLPAFFLLAGLVAAQLKKIWQFGMVLVLVCTVNGLAFLAWPTTCDGLLLGMGRSAGEIRQHDDLSARTFRQVRSQFNPADTLICHANENFMLGLRQFQVYLPEFDQYLCQLDRAMVSPADKPMLGVHQGQLDFVAGPALDGKRQILLVVPPSTSIEMFSEYADLTKAEPVPGSDGILQVLPVAALRQDIVAQAKRRAAQQPK